MPNVKRVNLTVGRIAEFKPPDSGQIFIWDSSSPGLAVRVTSGGSKSFVFQHRMAGRTVRKTIGTCSAWRLSEAREEARRLRRLVDQGIDPRDEEKEKRDAEALKSMLVADAFKDYLAAQKNWSERHMLDHLYLIRAPEDGRPAGVLYPLFKKRLVDVDVHALIQWAEDVTKAPSRGPNNKGRLSALQKGFVRFRAFWNWVYQKTDDYGSLADPSMFSNQGLRELLPPSRARSDVLQKGQLSAWFEVVKAIDSRTISAFLQALLLTGARRNELSFIKWTDIDFKWKSIHLKDKVEEAGRVIPLTPYVEFLLSDLPKRNEWVFSSVRSQSGRLVEPRIAHKRALAAAELSTDLSLHGLRRSFASLAEWVEMPAGILAQIMGHKPSATAEKHYKVRPLDLLALWHCKFEAWIVEQAGVSFSASGK